MDPAKLPRLRGSDRQVRWAEQIRAGYLAVMAKHRSEAIAELMKGRSFPRRKRDEFDEMNRLHEWIRHQVSASWWIERRGNSYQRFEWDALHEMKQV